MWKGLDSMGKVLRCPHCGSTDIKERVITMDDFIDGAIRAVELGAKRIFTGKWEWQETLNDISLDRASNPYKNTKKSYRCKSCGNTWDSRQ